MLNDFLRNKLEMRNRTPADIAVAANAAWFVFDKGGYDS
jgi:hypothetical protein